MKKEEARRLLSLDASIDVMKVEMKKEGEMNVKYVYVKSNRKKSRCSKCDNFSNKIHDYLKPSKITYLKNSGENTYLIVHKRRFECKHCKKSFTEDLGLSNKKCNISNKTKQMILKECLDRDKTLDAIARDCNTSVNIVRETFMEAMKNYPDNVEFLPEVISFDETATHTKEVLYSFILNDPIHKITLDILKSRKKEYLINYFSKVKNRYSVKAVICDLYYPYYQVVKICFPKAIFIADPFHYTRYIEDGLDKVRIRLIHRYENDKNSYEYKLLKNKKNVSLLRKYSNEIDWFVYVKRYKNGNIIYRTPYTIRKELFEISDELHRGYQLKELFLDITSHTDYEDAERQLLDFIDLCKESKIEEFVEASKTIENWLPYIVNSFIDKRYTNGFNEGINNKIKVIKRNAFGYKNFDFFRKRILYIFNKNISGGTRNGRKNNKKN